jgi:hypothetical protein
VGSNGWLMLPRHSARQGTAQLVGVDA